MRKKIVIFFISQLVLTLLTVWRFTSQTSSITIPFYWTGNLYYIQIMGIATIVLYLIGMVSLTWYLLDEYDLKIRQRIEKRYGKRSRLTEILDFLICSGSYTLFALGLSLGLVGAIPLIYVYLIPIIGLILWLSKSFMKTKKDFNGTPIKWKKFSMKSVLVLLIIFTLVLPYFVGQLYFSNSIEQAKSIISENDKIIYAGKFTLDHTFSAWNVLGVPIIRFNEDLSGYYILGMGACAELSYVEKTFLQELNISSRQTVIAEDHEILEVNVNNTWMVSDSGYGYWLNSTWERGQSRLMEFGGVSLIYLKYITPLEFVTQNYVPTDTINIQVLKNGSAYSNGTMILIHKFLGVDRTVGPIQLDSTGKITLRIGSMQYFPSANAENYFRVIIDNREVANITSYGNYTVWPSMIINL